MKGYRTETHDILIEFEGDGLALADEVRKLRGVLAGTKRVKPFEWEDFGKPQVSAAQIDETNANWARVYVINDQYIWELESDFIMTGGKCNSLLDGKMKASEAWSKWLGQFLEKVEL